MKKLFLLATMGALFASTTHAQSANSVITGDIGTKTTSYTGATQTNSLYKGATITVSVGALSATLTPTVSLQLQFSPNGGTSWLDFGDSTTNITAGTKTIVLQVYPTNFTTAGSSPSALRIGGDVLKQFNAVLPKTWRVLYHIRSGSGSVSCTLAGTWINYHL